MRIAVFGGSFNPVHNGHIKLAAAVHEQAGYDRIVFVPAYHSPFKMLPSGATDEDRLRMLELALAGLEWASVEDCEIKRRGVSYTYDTVSYLKEKYSAAGMLTGKLGLVIGADLVGDFGKWYRSGELVEMVDVVLARRTVDGERREDFSLPFVRYELKNPYVDVSSSEVREIVRDRSRLEALVPESVCSYILERRLYE